MPTIEKIFEKAKIKLHQNESLDLDHYYQEPYQDEDDEIEDMDDPFETNGLKRKRDLRSLMSPKPRSLFSFFMDGSRRTYKIGDIVLGGK